MSDEDKKDIAELVAQNIQAQPCPHGLTTEEVAVLKEFAQAWTSSKKTFIKTIVSGIGYAILVAIFLGVIAKLKELIK